ncbi:hypothetical protein [Desulfobacter sp.]
MKNDNDFKKIILTGLFLFLIFLLASGCATTSGKFSSLENSKSTRDEVRELLGEPDEIRSQENQDIWKYTFSKFYKPRLTPAKNKVLVTEIYFQEDVMTDYQITVVAKSAPEKKHRPPRAPMQGYYNRINTPKAQKFMADFDLNKDGVVTIKEYKGPPRLFKRIDKNHDNLINLKELNQFKP